MLKLLLTCEHGGNQIPVAYQSLFQEHQDELKSHAGYDIGALDLYRELESLADIGFYSETSRLLVELNRSLHHKKLFSDYTRNLADSDKNFILKNYYYPYRDKVEQLVHDFVSAGRRVLHISVHSFTPVLDGEERQADIGLLYDPKRKGEQQFCREWRQAMANYDSSLLVRNNYPYLGIADGFPTYLRRRFKENEYLGVELEVNQKFPQGNAQQWQALKNVIKESLADAMEHKRPNSQQEQVA